MTIENEELANMIGNAIDFPVCVTEEKSGPGSLMWLDDDDVLEDAENSVEEITRGTELAFEMCIDEHGEVRNTVVVRIEDGKAYGVPLSIDKLMHLGRWSLGNALHQLDLIEEFQSDSLKGELGRSMSTREVATTLKALKKASPVTFVEAFNKNMKDELVKTTDAHYQEKLAAAELRIRLELEKKYSAPLLKMADAIITGDDTILDDPLLQDSLIRAKKLHDDGAK